VTAEGRHVTTYPVDVARLAGPDRAWHVVFAVPVTDGTLNLRTVRTHGRRPLIGAVEVDYRNAATTQTTLFRDEFNGLAGTPPSSLRWQFENGGSGFGNGELQTNTSRPRNASLDGKGHLFITARKEWWTGSDGFTRQYTSARIKTDRRFSFQYGTATARIHIPRGRGLWPAFWALGDNFTSVGWPLCGEIDVMENIGSRPRMVYATVHAGRQGGGSWLAGEQHRAPDRLSDDYHVYGVEWGPSALAFWLDGVPYMTVSSADVAPGDLWNFLVLDLAVGGSWPGPPGPRTRFPATMAVDYVHVRA
jgi:beta-glucanase (GH16 family)